MTPSERAEKIIIDFNGVDNIKHWTPEEKALAASIVIQIAEAEREAEKRGQENDHQHKYLMARNKAYVEGFRAAREKAAKICDDNNHREPIYLADEIRTFKSDSHD